MSTDLDEFFARARSAADSIAIPRAADVRHRGDRRRRRQTTIVVFSVVVFVAATVSGVMLTSRQRAMPHPATTPRPVPSTAPKGFAALHQIGTSVKFGNAGRTSIGSLLIDNGEGFAAWRTAQPDQLVVAAFNPATGGKAWGPTKIDAQGEWFGLSATPDGQTFVGTVIGNEGTDPPMSYWFIDRHDGSVRWHSNGSLLFITSIIPILNPSGGPPDVGVVIESRNGDLVGRSLRDGHTLWRLPVGTAQGMHVIPEDPQDEETGQGGLRMSRSQRFLVQESTGQVRYYDSRSGRPSGDVVDLAGRTVIGAFDGTLYAQSDPSTVLEVVAVLDGRTATVVYKGESPQTAYLDLTRCFIRRACFVDGGRILMFDPRSGTTTTITPDFPPARIVAFNTFGILASAAGREPETPYALFDIKGERVGSFLAPGSLDLVTAVAGAVLMPDGRASETRSTGFTALTYDGTTGSLGQIPISGPCAVAGERLLCLDESGVGSWSYR